MGGLAGRPCAPLNPAPTTRLGAPGSGRAAVIWPGGPGRRGVIRPAGERPVWRQRAGWGATGVR